MAAEGCDAHVERHAEARIEELMRLCAQPSISAEGVGMEQCAELVGELLARRGARVRRIETPSAPVVYGEIGEGERALLLYNHYDVVPAGPQELWETPPFEPALRHGRLYARGVADNKGNIVARLAALDAYLAVHGPPPFKLKFLIEGDEETGSRHLGEAVAANAGLLRADGCRWENGGVDESGRPLFSLGLRGAIGLELRVRTLTHDAHSGIYSYLPNAAWRLVWALASIKGPDERILIDGFHDGIGELTPRVRELLDALPRSAAEAAASTYGVHVFAGGISAAQVNEAPHHPSVNVTGVHAGYQGPGMMRIIPHAASCKLDVRLVPAQDPQQVPTLLRRHLDARGFEDVEIVVHDMEPGVMTDPDDPFVRLTLDAAAEVYAGAPVVIPLIGGGGPMQPFVEHLGVPVSNAGVTYPGAAGHAPNEHIRIADWVTGARFTARILERFGAQATGAPHAG
jgi:acetylornithine deacetylase/succinyl-diaminopimelate desuccinylase-like protein